MKYRLEFRGSNQYVRKDPTTHFWSYVNKSTGPDGCWLWMGSRTVSGYGRFGLGDGRYFRAHRVSYEMVVGEVPKGLTLDHLCRNKLCVNPYHLEPVTAVENVRRAMAALTHCKNGHPFAGENLVIDNRGWRRCRICLRANDRRYKAKVRTQK